MQNGRVAQSKALAYEFKTAVLSQSVGLVAASSILILIDFAFLRKVRVTYWFSRYSLKILFIYYSLAGVMVVRTLRLGLPFSPSDVRLFLRVLSLSLDLLGLAMRLYC